MSRLIDQRYLAGTQYKDASCLNARANLHRRFSTNKTKWQHWIWDRFNLPAMGVDANHKVRIVELPAHRFYVATLFLPQLTSSPEKSHPLILAYLKAALSRGDDT